MPGSVFDLYLVAPAFLLVLFRVAGLMLSAPLFGAAIIPARVKAILVAAVALAVFPLVRPSLTAPVTLSSAVAGMVGELMVGLFIGYAVTLVFVGVQLAAEVVSYQAGIALGQAFNPMLDTEATELSQFYFLVAMMVFLAAGGDRAVIGSLLDSFSAVPPLGFRFREDLVVLLVDLLEVSFTLAIRVAGPVVLALMLAFVTLGFVSRTVPQLNILTVGFPIKLALALAIMALTIISMEDLLQEGLAVSIDGIRQALGLGLID